ncbi:MAG: hypothetical protein LBH87_03630 [Coriobacteriales bacterium]|jgi:hypothetical protein|nr:hypothetical protein [Coriobacteriales bacterium]
MTGGEAWAMSAATAVPQSMWQVSPNQLQNLTELNYKAAASHLLWGGGSFGGSSIVGSLF